MCVVILTGPVVSLLCVPVSASVWRGTALLTPPWLFKPDRDLGSAFTFSPIPVIFAVARITSPSPAPPMGFLNGLTSRSCVRGRSPFPPLPFCLHRFWPCPWSSSPPVLLTARACRWVNPRTLSPRSSQQSPGKPTSQPDVAVSSGLIPLS